MRRSWQRSCEYMEGTRNMSGFWRGRKLIPTLRALSLTALTSVFHSCPTWETCCDPLAGLLLSLLSPQFFLGQKYQHPLLLSHCSCSIFIPKQGVPGSGSPQPTHFICSGLIQLHPLVVLCWFKKWVTSFWSHFSFLLTKFILNVWLLVIPLTFPSTCPLTANDFPSRQRIFQWLCATISRKYLPLMRNNILSTCFTLVSLFFIIVVVTMFFLRDLFWHPSVGFFSSYSISMCSLTSFLFFLDF